MSDADFLSKESELERLRQRVAGATDVEGALAALDALSTYLSSRSEGASLTTPKPEPTFDVFRGIAGSSDVEWVAGCAKMMLPIVKCEA